MTRLQTLSEADVRLRLYPSTGRVVKVTEGYWPERRDLLTESCVVHTARSDGLFPAITVDALLSDEARLPISDTIKLYMQGQAARHFRLKAMGMPCDCTVCRPR